MAVSNSLYERDFYAWVQRNAQLLRDHNFAEADVANIAREIEDMGISQRRELRSHLRQLLEHLLKIACAPRPEACDYLKGWQKEIRNRRREISDLLERMPSLERFLSQGLANAFEKAREDFLEEYRIPAEMIRSNPFPEEQVLNLRFLPEYVPGQR